MFQRERETERSHANINCLRGEACVNCFFVSLNAPHIQSERKKNRKEFFIIVVIFAL